MLARGVWHASAYSAGNTFWQDCEERGGPVELDSSSASTCEYDPLSDEESTAIDDVAGIICDGDIADALPKWHDALGQLRVKLRAAVHRFVKAWAAASSTTTPDSCVEAASQEDRDPSRDRLSAIPSCLEELGELLKEQYSHLGAHLAELHDLAGDSKKAAPLFAQALRLCDDADDSSMRALPRLSRLLWGPQGHVYREVIPRDTTVGQQLLSDWKQVSQLKTWLDAVVDNVNAEPHDLDQLLTSCEECRRAYESARGVVQSLFKIDVKSAFNKIAKKRRRLGRKVNYRLPPTDAAKQQKVMSRAMLQLISALKSRRDATDLERFHDAFDFFMSLRLQHDLLSEGEMRDQYYDALRQAWDLGHRITQDVSQAAQIMQNSGKRSNFYSRLGQVGVMLRKYRCIPSSDSPSVLRQAIQAYHMADPVSPKDVANNNRYIGECHYYLGEFDRAADVLKEVAESNQMISATRWEASKRVAEALHAIAMNSEDPEERKNVFETAERWMVNAARVWEPHLDPRRRSCSRFENIALHGILAWQFFERGLLDAAEDQIGFFNKHSENIRDGLEKFDSRNLYVLATIRCRQKRGREAKVMLTELLSRELHPDHQIRPLALLRKILFELGESDAAREVNQRLREVCGDATTDCLQNLEDQELDVLFDPSRMADYLRYVKQLLREDRAGEVLAKLPNLARAAHFINGYPDVALLTQIAIANRVVGDYQRALAILRSVRKAGRGKKNEAISLFEIGKTYMRMKKYSTAAVFFERSCEAGDGINLGTLFMAALAWQRSGDYDSAERHLAYLKYHRDEDVLDPLRVDLLLAETLFHKAEETCGAEEFRAAAGGEVEAKQACNLLENVIVSPTSQRNRSRALFLLAGMANHPDAQRIICSFVVDENFDLMTPLIEHLENSSIYPDDFVVAIAMYVAHRGVQGSPPSFVNASIDYIMGAWVHAYVNRDRGEASSVIENTVKLMMVRNKTTRFWGRLLACNKGKMERYIHSYVDESLLAMLTSGTNEPHTMNVDHVGRIFASLSNFLQTDLLHLMSPAYAGFEPARLSCREECRKILSSFGRLPFSAAVPAEPKAVDDEGSIEIPEFSKELLWNLSTRVFSDLDVLAKNRNGLLRTIEIRLRRDTDGTIEFALFLSLDGDSPIDCSRDLPDTCRYMKAMRCFVPEAARLEFQVGASVLELTVRFFSPGRRRMLQPKWRGLYEYVVDETWEKRDLGPHYYLDAINHMPEAFDSNEVVTYLRSRFDGVFTKVWRRSVLPIREKTHTLKNTLGSIGEDAGNGENLGDIAQVIHASCRDIVHAPPKVSQPFRVHLAIEGAINEISQYVKNVDFEFRCSRQASKVVLVGSRHFLQIAIREICFNAINAIRQGDDADLRLVRASVVADENDVAVSIVNSGPPEPYASGFRIGSKTIKRVVEEYFQGSVHHGPRAEDDALRYGWNLRFPIRHDDEVL
jgi:tetratricopeptide (TPR) repeat protein